jgi:hypothetical protein
MPLFTGVAICNFMIYFTEDDAVIISFECVKCLSFILLILRYSTYLSSYCLLVVMLHYVLITLLHTPLILLVVPYVTDRLLPFVIYPQVESITQNAEEFKITNNVVSDKWKEERNILKKYKKNSISACFCKTGACV